MSRCVFCGVAYCETNNDIIIVVMTTTNFYIVSFNRVQNQQFEQW